MLSSDTVGAWPRPASPHPFRSRRVRRLGAAALLGLGLLANAAMASADPTGAISARPPLPASDYRVRPVCAAVLAPNTATCLSAELVPLTPAALEHTHLLGAAAIAPASAAQPPPPSPHSGPAAAGLYGVRPQDLHSAYDLPDTTAVAPNQTIAVVDAYDDPGAEADLAIYDEEFGLPPCTSSNGCFRKLNQEGKTGPLPTVQGEWAMEIALDVETAHAVCRQCRIVLIEAATSGYANLEAAEQHAPALGATEISNSWGGEEPALDGEAFNHRGVVITAAAGDFGYRNWDGPVGFTGFTDYPASSPHVVAVGGTRLSLGRGASWSTESVWNGQGATGGGCSDRFPAAPWQRGLAEWSSVGCESTRAVSDVAADADPYTGVAVYDSTPITSGGGAPGWITLGGTSLATPIIAGAFALAGGGHSGSGYAAQTLYQNRLGDPSSLHDIASGSNGECGRPFSLEGLSGCTPIEEAASCAGRAICLAGQGYDGPAGVGTPDGICAFEPPIVCGSSEGVLENAGTGGEVPGGSTPTGTPPPGGSENGGATSGDVSGAGQQGSLQPPASSAGSAARRRTAARVSRIALTSAAQAALARSGSGQADRQPVFSDVAFTCVLSRAARVRVTLTRLLAPVGHPRWRAVAGPFSLFARTGRNTARLRGDAALAAGRYRLTLAPAGGAPRSLTFVVR
jgi:hypothetical protein